MPQPMIESSEMGESPENASVLNGVAVKKGTAEGDVDADELARGIEIESEHTDDPEMAKRIALDHLSEIPDYYTRLDAMESEAKEEMGEGPEGPESLVEDKDYEGGEEGVVTPASAEAEGEDMEEVGEESGDATMEKEGEMVNDGSEPGPQELPVGKVDQESEESLMNFMHNRKRKRQQKMKGQKGPPTPPPLMEE